MQQDHGLTADTHRWSSARAVTIEPQPDAQLQEAQTALNEAARLKDEGRYAEAVPHAERALSLRKAVLGLTHVDVTQCMYLLSMIRFRLGEFAEALQLLQHSLKIRQELLGSNHSDVADLLNSLGIVRMSLGQFKQAEPLFQRARAIWEVACHQSHPKLSTVLLNLATLYKHQGLYRQAEPLYAQASVIDEVAYGHNHPRVAGLLDSLASLYTAQGEYGRAEPLYERALAIRESALGRSHPYVADSLNNLALFYMDKGEYERAEPLFERALAVEEAVLGKNHLGLVRLLNNLANLYKAQGLYERTESLYTRALSIAEATLGEAHPDVAAAVTNLATLYAAQGQYGQAQPLYERALRIQEAALGHSHPDVALTLHDLASLFADQGLYERAARLYTRAIAVREEALGGAHPLVAASLANLATLYRDQGLHARAEPLYERALSMQGEALGEFHPEVAETLGNLAQLRVAQGRLADALPLFSRSFTSSERRLRREALGFSDVRLASFLRLLRREEERLYSLLRAHLGDADVRRLVLSAVLLLKGRSMDELASISRIACHSLDAQDWRTFQSLRALRTQLATLSLQGPGPLSPADHQQRLKTLAEQGDALEAQLARSSAPLRARAELPSPAEIVDRVAQALPQDSVLVEFISYTDRPLVPEPGGSAQLTRQPRYLALVLFPDASIRAVDLGPAEPIDAAASQLRNALANRDVSFQSMAEAFYAQVFQPLLPLLEGRRHLFLSPDGQLSLVPFAALHDGQQFLVDSYDITYLTSGNDLLPRPADRLQPGSVVVFADPDFKGQAPEPSLCAEGPENPWVSLPGTLQEAEAIRCLIPQAQVFLGAEASTERLLKQPAPGVLHLATHGFFMGDTTVVQGARNVGCLHSLGEAPVSQPTDPLLRSGLVLAGARAQEAGASGAARPSSESGLVTALELAGLDLWGTELVVLSACDTGQGEVKLGQGVYGLRRAFMVAGAETVVMSLWKVNDETTRQLMEGYYRNLLAGKGRAAALRETMRALRLTQPHPHFWAPFIAVGEEAPLRAFASAAKVD